MREGLMASVRTQHSPGNAVPAKFPVYGHSSPDPHRLRLATVFEQCGYGVGQHNSVSRRHDQASFVSCDEIRAARKVRSNYRRGIREGLQGYDTKTFQFIE